MRVIASFSGGKTSAYMTIKLKKQYGADLLVLFANTGQEHDETLSFINKCDKTFSLNVVWLESVVHHNQRKSCTYKIVDFDSSDRKGEVFEAMISKYGIPNKAYPHCTRELKLNPINSWIKEHVKEPYKMAIGIRADEARRASVHADKNNLFYPLIEDKIHKFEVNEFWDSQSFNLNLKDYQGNCKTCFKKSNKKLSMIAKESPELFKFNLKMEEIHGLSGYNVDGNRRVFFRGHTSAKKLLAMNDVSEIELTKFRSYIDEDENSGCSESCEAFI